MSNRVGGYEGEALAARYLEAHGFTVLERNYTIRGGEIDLIAREGETVVFIEVKRRASLAQGRPIEAVDVKKCAHIVRASVCYLYEHGLDDAPVRYDVVEVMPQGINHVRNAFDATDLL